jgi:Nickel responsive protein SCO4226-like
MSVVVVERTFEDPVTYESIKAAFDRQPGCLEAHRVRYLKSYFAGDRKRMLCLYEAPDAESVRRLQDTVHAPFVRAWTALAIPFGDPEPREGVVVVERALDPALDEAAIRAAAEDDTCRTQWGCRLLGSYLSTDGRRCLCLYEAPDAESVRQVQQTGTLPYERAWTSAVHDPLSTRS